MTVAKRLRDTRRASIPPENDRCEPSGGDGHHCRSEAVEHAMIPRGDRDDLRETRFVDLQRGGRACDLRAVREQPDINLIGADRHLGRQWYRGAEQRGGEESYAVGRLTVEPLIAFDLDERDAEGIIAGGIRNIDAGALRQG